MILEFIHFLIFSVLSPLLVVAGIYLVFDSHKEENRPEIWSEVDDEMWA